MKIDLKFLVLILLSFSASVFGAYVAPAKDTVCVVGGLGTQANKDADNGGGATKTAWDAGSPSDFIATNGGPITSETADGTAYDHTGNGSGERCLTETGIGTGVTVGTLISIYDTGANVDDGIYEITNVVDADNVLVANINATDDDTVSYRVGGALDALQNALDEPLNNAASYNRYIYTNLAETLTAAIDVDTYGGSNTTDVVVKGANSSCVVDGTRPVITGNASVASGLLSFTNTSTYTQWWYLDFNAGGANKFDYGIYNAAAQSTSKLHSFYDCIIRGALDVTGMYIRSATWSIISCKIYGNGEGIHARGTGTKLNGCSIHDNTNDGVDWLSGNGSIANCLIYDNTSEGITGDADADYNLFEGNTIFGNGSHGVTFSSAGADFNVFLNNTSCGNGTEGSGYGYNFTDAGNTHFFAFNHSCDNAGDANDNADGHCNLMTDPTSDSEWDDFLEGNNQHGDPKFTDISDVSDAGPSGNEDFTPTSGSPLIDNAMDAGTN